LSGLPPVTLDQCRDPDDLPVLGTAVAGGANLIITGDQDLLVLQRFGACDIISPRTFYDRYVAGA
jgi:predicted nucleic acid-binding protein